MAQNSTSRTICQGESYPSITVTPSGGTAPYVVTFTSPSGATSTGTTVVTNAAGVWQWVAVDATGCSSLGAAHTLSIEPDPTSSIAIVAENKCVGVGQTISATGVPAGYTYSWNFGVQALPTSSTTAATNVIYSTGGTKTITLTVSKYFAGVGTGCSHTCTWVKTRTIVIGTLTGTVTCSGS